METRTDFGIGGKCLNLGSSRNYWGTIGTEKRKHKISVNKTETVKHALKHFPSFVFLTLWAIDGTHVQMKATIKALSIVLTDIIRMIL